MKVLWVSCAPWVGSGYGQQTALFTQRFAAAGHDVALAATWGLEGNGIEWPYPDGSGDLNIYPSASNEWRWFKIFIPSHAAHHGGGDPLDVQVISLVDVYTLTLEHFSRLRFAAWCPVDHVPAPPRVVDFFKQTQARPIAMSRFGEEQLQEAGLDPLYVPHGIDCDVYQPRTDQAAVRAALGIPADAFVVGMVARNSGLSPPRKAFPQVFQAFAEFRRKHDDAFLYLHTDRIGMEQGINLSAVADACAIPPEAMTYTDPYLMAVGISQESMSGIYGCFDVLANPSYGEGFGIPIVEAQACGVPVIVTNWTSMPELKGAGWVVDGDPVWDPHHGAFYKSPSVAEIYDALEAAYECKETRAAVTLAGMAREFALQYDADTVMSDYWTPALAELDRPREIAPLKLVSKDPPPSDFDSEETGAA